MRIALLLQYNGSNYHGWQRQKDPETVQGHLERVLQKVFNSRIGLVGSGRTDSGVHALGQVAHFDIESCDIPINSLWKAINRELPDDIRLLASRLASDQFHSRFAANKRQYLYQIATQPNVLHRHFQWYMRFHLDLAKLEQISLLIIGEHDFSSFCYAGTETENMICNIYIAKWQMDSSGVLSFHVQADRFLHHMVRMLVGCMVEVARGKWEIEHFMELLDHPDRRAHTITAPAHGLTLIKVSYPKALQPDWE